MRSFADSRKRTRGIPPDSHQSVGNTTPPWLNRGSGEAEQTRIISQVIDCVVGDARDGPVIAVLLLRV